jgi:hypothetical protein
METKQTIYTKLLNIQKQVKGLSKDKKSHNYDYVTGNKLLSFIKPLMDEQGLILKQEITSIENERQNYQVWDKWMDNGKDNPKGGWKDKSEILSKVMMRFTWIDTETGEKDENLFGANGQNDWEKGLGSALTYGERYFLLKFFHIATDEDDIDNPNRKPEEKESSTKPVQKKTPEQPIKKAEPKLKEAGELPEMSDKLFKTALALTEKHRVEKALESFKMSNDMREELTVHLMSLDESN